ncbi:MAG TPA: pentapeptide repeat-containing protein [Candidatus Acidoferrales bacterium]|nr:pentapeptide repeat-containing protein [Candidatus Acidoferrales bacterium]
MKLKFHFGPWAEERDEAVTAEQEAKGDATLTYWCRKFGDPELDEIVEEHRAWVESRGESGRKADLTGANFEGADLMGAPLQGANLMRANLKGADLLLADLRGACLIEADLSEANLVSTNLRGASLLGANLATATGLVARQLAGASLFGASVPESLYPFEGLAETTAVAKVLRILLAGMAAICAGVCIVVAKTKDAQLLKNSPFAPVPVVGGAIPMLAFYLIAPMLLAGIYICFHFYLQRLWDALGELPAVFPDGRRLTECVPLSMIALAPVRLAETNSERSAFRFLQRLIFKAIAYWMVPATLLLVWARYLAEQDWRGSLLQIFFILAAAAMSGFLPGKTNSIFGPARSSEQHANGHAGPWRTNWLTITALSGCILLVLLSVGAILGAPHDVSRAPELKRSDVRRWTANAFWVIGYDPFPNLTEAEISSPPQGWTGLDDLSAVKGARLENASLRYAQAYRAFFAKSRMQGADLKAAYLAEADFRGANLSNSSLASANLSRADLRAADLMYASLENAILAGARLDVANFYDAQMTGAQLARASIVKADLRGAILRSAEMNQTDLQGAYLGSAKLENAQLDGAQLSEAFLDSADLRGASLRGAIFQSAILSDADLHGANLDNADLRGALTLTAMQVCSTASHTGAQMDAPLEQQVEALCGDSP